MVPEEMTFLERMAGRSDPESRNGLDLYFAPTKQHPRRAINVFFHIQKTAGSTVRHYADAGLSEARRLRIDVPWDEPTMDLKRWHRTIVRRMTKEERGRLVFATGHSANYLIEALDRPVVAATMLREPIDRVLSRFYFSTKGRGYDVREHYVDEARHGYRPEWFNGQARRLLMPFYDVDELACTFGPAADADLWRQRLFETVAAHYHVVLQTRFAESIAYLQALFGWTETPPEELTREKVNPRRPRDLVFTEEQYALMRAANWLDLELYEHLAGGLENLDGPAFADATGVGYRVERPEPASETEALVLRLERVVEAVVAESRTVRHRLEAIEHLLAVQEEQASTKPRKRIDEPPVASPPTVDE